jgi:hypothetical protein
MAFHQAKRVPLHLKKPSPHAFPENGERLAKPMETAYIPCDRVQGPR